MEMEDASRRKKSTCAAGCTGWGLPHLYIYHAHAHYSTRPRDLSLDPRRWLRAGGESPPHRAFSLWTMAVRPPSVDLDVSWSMAACLFFFPTVRYQNSYSTYVSGQLTTIDMEARNNDISPSMSCIVTILVWTKCNFFLYSFGVFFTMPHINWVWPLSWKKCNSNYA